MAMIAAPAPRTIRPARGLTADGLARALTDSSLVQKLKADKILNLLPLAEAVVYKAGTRT